jgi:membrane protease YdiL (CAAX protease family)
VFLTGNRFHFAFIAYTLFYIGSLFFRLENEADHWLTMVLIPLAILLLANRHSTIKTTAIALIRSLGLSLGGLRKGFLIGAAVGIPISVFQEYYSERSDSILAILGSSKVFIVLPMTFVLMLFTAGFTEEFFFRGVLQNALTRVIKSNVAAILLASIVFGLYHLPYAYLHPNWPSHGDLAWAFRSAMGQGMIGGIIFGSIYVLAKRNLWATIFAHTFINLLPAMTMLKMGGKVQ